MAENDLSRRAVLGRGAILAPALMLAGAAALPGESAIGAAFARWIALDPLDTQIKGWTDADLARYADIEDAAAMAVCRLPAACGEELALKIFVALASIAGVAKGKVTDWDFLGDRGEPLMADLARLAPALRPHLVVA